MNPIVPFLAAVIAVIGVILWVDKLALADARSDLTALKRELALKDAELSACSSRVDDIQKDRARDAETYTIPALDLPFHVRPGWMREPGPRATP